jgi:hypothetical protein
MELKKSTGSRHSRAVPECQQDAAVNKPVPGRAVYAHCRLHYLHITRALGLPCASSLRLEISVNRCELPRASQRRATQSTRHPALGWAVRTLQSLRKARLITTRPHAHNHVWRPTSSGHRPSSIVHFESPDNSARQ